MYISKQNQVPFFFILIFYNHLISHDSSFDLEHATKWPLGRNKDGIFHVQSR